MNITDYISDERISSKICSKASFTCCKTDIFDLLKVVNKPLLHKLSGQSTVHSKLRDFVVELKYRVMLLMDVYLVNVFRDLSYWKGGSDIKFFMKNLHLTLHTDLRLKLAGDNRSGLEIREKIMEALSVSRNVLVCLSREDYENRRFTDFVDKVKTVFERSLLLYRRAMKLESIISQIEVIEISQGCIDDLLKMILCGLCTEQLDFTLYNTSSTQYNNNVKICPKYCYNVVRKCMSFFLHLVKPLENYKIGLLRFSKIYKEIITKDLTSFWGDKTQIRSFSELINYIKKKATTLGNICQDPADIRENLNQDGHLQDIQDKKAINDFDRCLQKNKCKQLNQKSDLLFANVLSSVETFMNLLKTVISPDYFIKNLLARPCDNAHYQRCWNGEEIGQYHRPVLDFSFKDRQLSTVLTTDQRDKVDALSRSMYYEAENLTVASASLKSISSGATLLQDTFEGSGMQRGSLSDDEDLGNNLTSLSPIDHRVTNVEVLKGIQFQNVNRSEGNLRDVSKNGPQFRFDCIINLMSLYFVIFIDSQMFL